MSKGEQTKQLIVARAAALFNQQGYGGTSISDLMQATGLQKGGIYNHFQGKDDLALHAFDYAYGIMRERYAQALRENRGDPLRQLLAVIEVATRTVDEPPVPGGCPILNTAVDSDDTHPHLRARVQQAVDEWCRMLERIVARGQERAIFGPDVRGDELASLIIATIEGALMLSRLYGDPIHVQRAKEFLSRHIRASVLHPSRDDHAYTS